jgi:hypothetical protein
MPLGAMGLNPLGFTGFMLGLLGVIFGLTGVIFWLGGVYVGLMGLIFGFTELPGVGITGLTGFCATLVAIISPPITISIRVFMVSFFPSRENRMPP